MIWEQAPQLFLILFISQEGQGSLQAIPDFAAPPDRAASAGFPALVLPFAFSPAYGSHELGSVVPFALILTISISFLRQNL
jgi:hypothetical protein